MAFSLSAPRRRIWLVLVVCWLLGALRLVALWAHDPLYAYANSYDETRYTTCFHLYPDRPAGIAPQQNSPAAPFEHYRFIATGDPMCYWSSELLFQGATAAIYRLGAVLKESFQRRASAMHGCIARGSITGVIYSRSDVRGLCPRGATEKVQDGLFQHLVGTPMTGNAVHSVRWIGWLRLAALLALSVAFSLAWLRRGEVRLAIANAILLPLLFADPGNTLYLNTFYAEWTALLAAYALIGLTILWRGEHRSRVRFALLALAALVLATSKIQHLMLPLALGVVVLILDRIEWQRTTWRAAALLLGGLAGLCFQFVQLQRDGAMMQAIRQYNAADVVFTALVPLADKPRVILSDLDISPSCARFRGKDAWQLPGLPDRVCAGLVNFSRGKELAVLLGHPRLAVRLVWHGVLALDPWLARDIGQVEGREFAQISAGTPSVGRLLHASRVLQGVLLAFPFAMLLWLALRRRWRGRAFEFAALTVVLMGVTFGVTILGDGLADTAKQGHLIINAALALLIVVAWCAWLPNDPDRSRRRVRDRARMNHESGAGVRHGVVVHAVDFDQ